VKRWTTQDRNDLHVGAKRQQVSHVLRLEEIGGGSGG
jgi:hypothetical protein